MQPFLFIGTSNPAIVHVFLSFCDNILSDLRLMQSYHEKHSVY
ncbi:MAG: hypothetical protein ACI9S6_002180 [Reinekea sp.]|jgi:hypothetical protein